MLKLLALDRFTILLVVMVILASIVPVSGFAADVFGICLLYTSPSPRD